MDFKDGKLAAELKTYIDFQKHSQADMHKPRPGCNCGPDGCCAWHAAVYNYLEASIVSLTWALQSLEAPKE